MRPREMNVPKHPQWHPTPVLLPGESHGRRSLVGCSPWGHWGSDTTERLHFHFSLSCLGEGNGNPLQCSCLENPRDRGAWWAAVYGVAQSQTRLKWLSSSKHPQLNSGSPGIWIMTISCKINIFLILTLWDGQRGDRWEIQIEEIVWDFLGGPVVKPLPSSAGVGGLIPVWGAKISHASQPKTKNQNMKQRQSCNKFNKALKKKKKHMQRQTGYQSKSCLRSCEYSMNPQLLFLFTH